MDAPYHRNGWRRALRRLVASQVESQKAGRAAHGFASTALVAVGFSAAALAASTPPAHFSRATSYATGGAYTHSVAVGDFNHDGRSDLITGNMDRGSGPGTTTVLLAGAHGFGPPRDLDANATGPVTVGDINGDGNRDVVRLTGGVPSGAPETSVVLLGNGRGRFPTRTTFTNPIPRGDAVGGVTVGDFNRDRKGDLVVTETGNWPDCGVVRPGVWVLLGDAAGGFSAPRRFAAGGAPEGVAVADLNRDRRPDLAVANSQTGCGQPGDVRVLLGDGNGGFATAQRHGRRGNPQSVSAGDFNRDRRPDLAVGSRAGIVRVLLGDGRGRFSRVRRMRAGYDPDSLAIADFNRDRKLDLAVGNISSGETPPRGGDIRLLLGKGNGEFSRAKRIQLPDCGGGCPMSLVSADFNRDRKPDIAAADPAFDLVAGGKPTAIWVFLNQR